MLVDTPLIRAHRRTPALVFPVFRIGQPSDGATINSAMSANIPIGLLISWDMLRGATTARPSPASLLARSLLLAYP